MPERGLLFTVNKNSTWTGWELGMAQTDWPHQMDDVKISKARFLLFFVYVFLLLVHSHIFTSQFRAVMTCFCSPYKCLLGSSGTGNSMQQELAQRCSDFATCQGAHRSTAILCNFLLQRRDSAATAGCKNRREQVHRVPILSIKTCFLISSPLKFQHTVRLIFHAQTCNWCHVSCSIVWDDDIIWYPIDK